VTLAPTAPGSIFATGAMSVASAGGATSLAYSDTLAIDFSPKSPETTVILDLLGFNALGKGFQSLQFTVSLSGISSQTENFSKLSDAENFFKNGNILTLGSVSPGSSDIIDISYYLTTSIGAAQGFGFNFNLDPPGGTVPSRRPGR
jgi:hypothetical protein